MKANTACLVLSSVDLHPETLQVSSELQHCLLIHTIHQNLIAAFEIRAIILAFHWLPLITLLEGILGPDVLKVIAQKGETSSL